MNETMYEIGVARSEDAVTQATREHREYLHSRGAERCAECGCITCTLYPGMGYPAVSVSGMCRSAEE